MELRYLSQKLKVKTKKLDVRKKLDFKTKVISENQKVVRNMQPVSINYNGYTITTDKSLMNVADIYEWLSEEAYWCKGIPYSLFKTTFDNSFCIGTVKDGGQVAYARLITDHATFGYLADVFVTETHRGKGISKQMMQILFDLDWVKGLRRIMLATRDAQDLYKKYGFDNCAHPERLMEIVRPSLYTPVP